MRPATAKWPRRFSSEPSSKGSPIRANGKSGRTGAVFKFVFRVPFVATRHFVVLFGFRSSTLCPSPPLVLVVSSVESFP